MNVHEIENWEEVKFAAEWWRNELVNFDGWSDTGNAFGDALSSYVINKTKNKVTELQADVFESRLRFHIAKTIKDCGYWDAKDVDHGSVFRIVRTNYHPCHVLNISLAEAAIEKSWKYLPKQVVMYINPGEIKVGKGYEAEVETVFTCEPSEYKKTLVEKVKGWVR